MRRPRPLTPLTAQRLQSEQALHRARVAAQERGIAPERIEVLQRVGTPADELVRAARELDVAFIVFGSRGDSLKEQMRRVVAGSTSRRVLRLAPCPVMRVVLP